MTALAGLFFIGVGFIGGLLCGLGVSEGEEPWDGTLDDAWMD